MLAWPSTRKVSAITALFGSFPRIPHIFWDHRWCVSFGTRKNVSCHFSAFQTDLSSVLSVLFMIFFSSDGVVLCGGYDENFLLKTDCFFWRKNSKEFKMIQNEIPYKYDILIGMSCKENPATLSYYFNRSFPFMKMDSTHTIKLKDPRKGHTEHEHKSIRRHDGTYFSITELWTF